MVPAAGLHLSFLCIGLRSPWGSLLEVVCPWQRGCPGRSGEGRAGWTVGGELVGACRLALLLEVQEVGAGEAPLHLLGPHSLLASPGQSMCLPCWASATPPFAALAPLFIEGLGLSAPSPKLPVSIQSVFSVVSSPEDSHLDTVPLALGGPLIPRGLQGSSQGPGMCFRSCFSCWPGG